MLTRLLRAAVAVVLAPLTTAIVVWAFLLGQRLLGLGVRAGDPLSEFVIRASQLAGIATVFVFIGTALASVPLTWWSLRRRLRLRDLTVLGLALAGLPFVANLAVAEAMWWWQLLVEGELPYGGWTRHWWQLREGLAFVVVGAASGAATGAVYWVIALRGAGPESAHAIIRPAKSPPISRSP